MTQIPDNPFEGADAPVASPPSNPAAGKPNPFASTPPPPRAAEPPRVDNPFQAGGAVAPPPQQMEQAPVPTPPVQTEPPVNVPQDPSAMGGYTNTQPTPDLSQGVTMQNQSMYGGGPGFPQPQGMAAPSYPEPVPPQNFQPTYQPNSQPPMQPQGFGQPQGYPQQPVQQPQQAWGGMQPAGAQYSPQGMPPAPAPAPAQHWGNNGGQNGQQKYNIVDMYWWVNKKYIMQVPFDQGEVGMLTVGFNANFNNMRFCLHNIDPNMINQPSLIITNCPRVTLVNVYSENAGEILASKGSGQTIMTQERVIKAGGGWTPNQSAWIWGPDRVSLYTQDQQGAAYSYTFLGPQITLLEGVLTWMIDGSAWNAALMMMK